MQDEEPEREHEREEEEHPQDRDRDEEHRAALVTLRGATKTYAGPAGAFTARRDQRGEHAYWYAYRQQRGRQHGAADRRARQRAEDRQDLLRDRAEVSDTWMKITFGGRDKTRLDAANAIPLDHHGHPVQLVMPGVEHHPAHRAAVVSPAQC